MKYLKKFENVNKPEIGDYVLVKSHTRYKEVKNFIDSNIGVIFKIRKDIITVKYKNIPSNIINKFSYINNNNSSGVYDFYSYKIENFSKNKEELEMILQAKKT